MPGLGRAGAGRARLSNRPDPVRFGFRGPSGGKGVPIPPLLALVAIAFLLPSLEATALAVGGCAILLGVLAYYALGRTGGAARSGQACLLGPEIP